MSHVKKSEIYYITLTNTVPTAGIPVMYIHFSSCFPFGILYCMLDHRIHFTDS